MAITMELKIYGQEMVEVNNKVAKGTVEVTERLMIKLKGMKGDSKTKFSLLVDPKFKDDYAIGEIATLKLEIEQTKLPLTTSARKATAAKPPAAVN